MKISSSNAEKQKTVSSGQWAVSRQSKDALCFAPSAYCLRTAFCFLTTAHCSLPTAYCLLLTLPDAAARYISKSIEQFKDDPMKEALALLAYNHGGQKTTSDLKALVNDQNKRCRICALAADRSKFDAPFQNENVYYVPRFFAAAIIGENPQAFGLQMQPLSSY
jgi:hypothetical protein